MIKSLERAIDKIRDLPPDRQELAASILEQIAEGNGKVYTLSDEERRLIREGLDDIDAGLIVSDDEMAAFWNRHQK